MSQADNLAALATNVNSSGVLQPTSGGTGATSTAAAPFATKGANSDITSITGLTTALSVAQGGTGVTTSTGTGSTVLSNSPTLVTPALGTPSSGNLANCTFPTLNQNTTGTAANVTGVVAVANGGTGQTTYTNGQLLIGNTTGNTLTKATLTAGSGISITNGAGSISIAATGGGTVTSVATGNGLSGGTITTTGTLVIACPSYNSVGAYVWATNNGNATAFTAGTNYAAGSGNGNIQSFGVRSAGATCAGGLTGEFIRNNDLSGTWKWMATSLTNSNSPLGMACRVS